MYINNRRDILPESYLAVLIGIGLSAACGFRVFIPLLVMSIASATGHIELSESMSWVSSMPAIIALSVASILEVSAYLIPFVDNLLDIAAGPAAVVAGTIVTASFITDMSPFVKWSVAIIAGGGVAASVQSATTIARTSSSTMTAGLGNIIVSSGEAFGAVFLSVLAILFPIIAIFSVIALLIYFFVKISKRFIGKKV